MPYLPVRFWQAMPLAQVIDGVFYQPYPDSKVHGANMGPTWGRQDPGGTHVGPMNFAIWLYFRFLAAPKIILGYMFVYRLHVWQLFW